MSHLAGDGVTVIDEARAAIDPYTIAMHLWCLYFASTEAYDRSLSGRWSPRDQECWLPHETALSARFARVLDRRIRGWLAHFEVGEHHSLAARHDAERLSYVRQAEFASLVKIKDGLHPHDLTLEINGQLLTRRSPRRS